MDIAVSLVESYLRLNGYLTLSEFEVQRRDKAGEYRVITDVDIMAMRMPGAQYVGDPHSRDDCDMLLINDPVLEMEDDMVDVIIGEVKQGEAVFNPGLMDHRVLHAMVRRVEWLYDRPSEQIVSELQQHNLAITPGRLGGRVRTRLVAFGQSPVTGLHVISLTHMVDSLIGFFTKHEDAFRPVQFRNPAPAFLKLLMKAGFDIDRDSKAPSG